MVAEDGSEGELAYETPRTISISTVPQFLGQVGCRGEGIWSLSAGEEEGGGSGSHTAVRVVTKVGT